MKQPYISFFERFVSRHLKIALDFRFSSEVTSDNPLRACPSDPSDRSGKYLLNLTSY